MLLCQSRQFGFIIATVLLAIMAAPAIEAQVLYGSVVGQVEDASGAVVPGASVSLASVETGITRDATADVQGRYSIPSVLPGSYSLKVTAPGFRTLTRTGVEVKINSVTRLDVHLEVGQINEQVTVSAQALALQSDKSDTRSEIPTRAIADLPLPNFRNYQSLLNLVPGATPGEFQNSYMSAPARSLRTQINGANPNNNSTRVDGAVNVFIWLPHHTAYVPASESIETVSVSTSSFDAEQGMLRSGRHCRYQIGHQRCARCRFLVPRQPAPSRAQLQLPSLPESSASEDHQQHYRRRDRGTDRAQ
jgi:hypothetical protein